ncbi:hypothetical protein TWF281_010353 [Arthrobotrys megalospora]
MAVAVSRSSLPSWGSRMQNISGPLSPDSGYIPKASGLFYQDIGASSGSKLPLSRALGIIPHSIGYGLAPFGFPMARNTGYYFMNTMTSSGSTQHLWNTDSSGGRKSKLLRDQGPESCIPEALALFIFQALNPPYPRRYTYMYHGPGINKQYGTVNNIFPGPFSRSLKFSSRINDGARFNPITNEPPRQKRSGHLKLYIGTGLNGQSLGHVKRKLLEFSPSLIELRGGSEGSSVNTGKTCQGRGNPKQRSSGRVNGYTQGSGSGGHKRKRTVDEDEEDEDSSPPPPPPKRIARDSPEPSGPRLACPFAKATPDIHLRCLLIGRKSLSGIKEHLKRNHFGKKLPDNIRAARSWNEVFDVCNPQWHQTQRPSPYLEPGKLLAASSRSNSTPTTSSEQGGHMIFPPENHQKVHNGIEFCSPPLSANGVSPRNGVIPYSRPEIHHQCDGGAPSPISCGHRSNRGSFSAPVEDLASGRSISGVVFPSGTSSNPPSWLTENPTTPRGQRNQPAPSHHPVPEHTWLSANNCGESSDQPENYFNEFGIGTGASTRNFYGRVPSLIDNPNESFEAPTTVDPSHLRYQDFLHSDLHTEVSIPWQNSVSPGTVDFGNASPTPTAVLNTSRDTPNSSLSIDVPPLQPAPKSRRGILKPITRSYRDQSKRKKYQLIVTRKPPNPSSEEPRRSHRFTFEDLDEFQAEFDPWLRREFTDPPFCWQKMEFLNGLEKARLSNIEEVADNLEVSYIHYRSFDAALYLVAKRSPPEPYSPVESTNTNREPTEAYPQRQ